MPQDPLGLEALGGPRLERLPVDLVAIAPPVLGSVHGQIGLAQQVVGQVVRSRGGGDSDAHRGDDLLVAHPVGLAERGHDAVGARAEIGEVGQGLHHDELVTAESGDGVLRPGDGQEPLRRADQHRVTAVVPQGVVDDLEMVEVQHEHPDQARVALEPLQGLVEAIAEKGAVGEAGDGVGEGVALHLLLGLDAVADVMECQLGLIHRPCRGIDDRPAPAFEPCVGAILAPESEAHVLDLARARHPPAGRACDRPVVAVEQPGHEPADELLGRVPEERHGRRRDGGEGSGVIGDGQGIRRREDQIREAPGCPIGHSPIGHEGPPKGSTSNLSTDCTPPVPADNVAS